MIPSPGSSCRFDGTRCDGFHAVEYSRTTHQPANSVLALGQAEPRLGSYVLVLETHACGAQGPADGRQTRFLEINHRR